MLNISEHSIKGRIKVSKWPSFNSVEQKTSGNKPIKTMALLGTILFILLFLPWTQNIRTKGKITTLKPEQRPQAIQSVIAGRIEKWYVQEGDFVRKGDTLLQVSETKDEYFDPSLLVRTASQVKAKESAVNSYMEKVKALDARIDAMVENNRLKLQQARNKLMQSKLKVQSDSIDLMSYNTNYQIAVQQYERMQQLYDKGLKSLTDLEKRESALQKAQAERISGENKLLTARNEVINAQVELNSINAKFRDEVAKAESEKFTAMSDMYDAEAVVTKLQNQFSNYSIRRAMYFITAPQDVYITKLKHSGIGETVKAGDEIVSIMPADYELAVELFINPVDLPLVESGQEVRIQFDGWPAIVFSGWPNVSHGTYGGVVYGMDNSISENGKYRILVKPDTSQYAWPEALRVGSATNNMLLLKDVPIWYELWRRINGFPPDYYVSEQSEAKTGKK